MQATDAVDDLWRPAAETARECIGLLGFPLRVPLCMPGEGERDTCSGTVAGHYVQYLATLRAVIDHQLIHLNATPASFLRVYLKATAEIGCEH